MLLCAPSIRHVDCSADKESEGGERQLEGNTERCCGGQVSGSACAGAHSFRAPVMQLDNTTQVQTLSELLSCARGQAVLLDGVD